MITTTRHRRLPSLRLIRLSGSLVSWLLVCVLVACGLSACGAARGMSGNAMVVDMSKKTATTPTLLVASKVQRPLLVVIDPAQVPDQFKLWKGRAQFIGFRSHMKRSLGKVLRTQFQDVRFVTPGYAAPKSLHLIADLRVDPIQLHKQQVGRMMYVSMEMQWAFAVRGSEHKEYVYSFAAASRGSGTYRTPAEGLLQATSAAMASFLSSYTEKKVHRLLKKLDSATVRQGSKKSPHVI